MKLKTRLMDKYGTVSPGSMIGLIIAVLIVAIIAFALFGTLLGSVASVNTTTKYATGSQIPALINLAPLLFVLIVIMAFVAGVLIVVRGATGD